MQHRIRLDHQNQVFTARHFVAFGDEVESLHTHTFRVVVTLSGALDANGMLIDFRVVRQVLREILSSLDGRVLLPQTYDLSLDFSQDSEEILLLPLTQISTELLAAWILNSLREKLFVLSPAAIFSFIVELQEEEGCWGIAEL